MLFENYFGTSNCSLHVFTRLEVFMSISNTSSVILCGTVSLWLITCMPFFFYIFNKKVMSALCCEPKTWWIYKEPVRSFLHFPHSYKSQTLSKYTAPNDFTTTIHPLQLFTHKWIFTVLLHCSVQWQWKYNKTEGRVCGEPGLQPILIP